MMQASEETPANTASTTAEGSAALDRDGDTTMSAQQPLIARMAPLAPLPPRRVSAAEVEAKPKQAENEKQCIDRLRGLTSTLRRSLGVLRVALTLTQASTVANAE